MALLSTLIGMFATKKTADTALGIIDRFANSDMTDKEKADFVIQYTESTKHQSPARRAIAMVITGLWGVTLLVWLSLVVLSHWFDTIEQIRMVRMFMGEVIKDPFNYVIMFYFAMHALKGIGDRKK